MTYCTYTPRSWSGARPGASRGRLGPPRGVPGEEGVLQIYSGLLTTLAGVLPFNSIKLAAYDLMRRRVTAKAAANQEAPTRQLVPVPTIEQGPVGDPSWVART